MSKPIVTALTSYGMSGEVFHAPVIAAHNGFELKYILERSKERSRERYPKSVIARSYAEILKDPTVELVIVNTPNPLHYPMTKEALLAGKNVVVEKPFTVTVDEGEELIDLAEQKGVLLSVFHNKRLEGEFKTVQQLVKEKTLGDLISFETRFDRFRPEIGPKKWKEEKNPGAGLLYDLGPHMIDQVLVLFGLPSSLDADLQVQREGGQVDDYFKITLYYPDFIAVVSASMFVHNPVKYIIKGTTGTYTKSGADPQEALLKSGHSPLEKNWGQEPKDQWGIIERNDGSEEVVPTLSGTYLDYYTSIYDGIRNKIKPVIAAQEALWTVRLIELAILSNKYKEKLQVG